MLIRFSKWISFPQAYLTTISIVNGAKTLEFRIASSVPMNTWIRMSVATSPPLFSEPGAGAPQRPSTVLAFVAIGSFAVQTLSLGVYAWFSRARAAAWNDAVAGRATLADARHAHHVLVLAARSTWVTLLLGAVCISLWAGRVVSNARSRGMRVSPRRARWMWFIPLFGIPLSIKELQKAVSGTDYSTHRLRRWLVAIYVMTVLSVFFFLSALVVPTTTTDALASLDRQALFATFMFLGYAIATAIAANAILHADKALTLRPSAA